MLFCCRSKANRPCIVTYLWIIIDLTIVAYITSLSVMPYIETQDIAYKIGYGSYYLAISLNIVFHWTFAMEYLVAVLKLPIILDIFGNNIDLRLKRTKWIIFVLNVLYYSAILAWQILNDFDTEWVYSGDASRMIVTFLQVIPALILVVSTHLLKR